MIHMSLIIFGAFLLIIFMWMFVSLVLDIAPPVATPVWVTLWIIMPFVMFLFPSIRYISSANRIESAFKEEIQYYNALDKNEKRLVPESAIKTLYDRRIPINQRYDVARELIRLFNELDNRRAEQTVGDIESVKAAIEASRSTLKEFG